MKKKHNYKYKIRLPKTFLLKGFLSESFEGRFIKICKGGLIKIKEGYAWDGCTPNVNVLGLFSLGTPNGTLNLNTGLPSTYRASLLHDALYQYREFIPISRKDADCLFYQQLVRDNFGFAKLYYWTVRIFGFSRDWKTKEFKNLKLL